MGGTTMIVVYVIVVMIVIALIGAALSVRIIKQYERVALFELGKVKDGARGPGMMFIVPLVDRVHRVSVLRNLQTLVEISVDKNSTVIFPAPLMSTIQELGAFLNRESEASAGLSAPTSRPTASTNGELIPS